ncbi:MAG: hypothetical protein QM760_19170 [Nibricoccus sp.]
MKTSSSGRTAALFRSLLERRHGGVLIFVLLFCSVAFLTRVALLVKSFSAVTVAPSLLAAFGWGFAFDIGTALLFALPLVLLLAFLPETFFDRVWARLLAHLGMIFVLALLIFGAVSEWVFWDEFSSRFNFIAVDYLVYTQEVDRQHPRILSHAARFSPASSSPPSCSMRSPFART